MVQGLEKINRKISTQFKLLELAEKETEQLLTKNKRLNRETFTACRIKVREITRIQVVSARGFIGRRWNW